jgi:hypothetical protein
VADPLSPITLLVGASLQRPWLQRWLVARLGAHANVRILMPADLALLLGAPALVTAHRRALPPLADRVLLAGVARTHSGYFAPVADTPGFGEALFRLVRELRGAGSDLADLGPLLDGLTDAPEKGVAGGHPGVVRGATRRLLRPGRCAAGIVQRDAPLIAGVGVELADVVQQCAAQRELTIDALASVRSGLGRVGHLQ